MQTSNTHSTHMHTAGTHNKQTDQANPMAKSSIVACLDSVGGQQQKEKRRQAEEW